MSSNHPHGYAYDLFVSYSTRDRNWVRVFYDDLVSEVNRLADFDIYPFLDNARLQPGYLWEEKLLAAARDSAVPVPVSSPRFFDSDNCQKEVRAFIGANGLSSTSAHRSRILPVKLLCSAPSGHVLARVQAESFCTERDGIPFEHQPGTAEYQEALRKIAYAIAQVLHAMPAKEQQHAAVYLAPDFNPSSDKLRASLGHRFEVLPQDPRLLLSFTSAEFEQAMEHDFARCFVSVHPLNAAPLAESLVKAQLDFARKQTKPRLVWTPDRPDDLTNAGFEWFTSQAEIEDRIRRLYEKPPEAKSSVAGRLIYFLCPDRRNKTRAEPLLEKLENRGVYVYPSPLEGPAEQALQTHINALDELDGCLIYYGEVERDWFDAVFPRVQRKIRQRRLLSAVFVAPPPTEHKTHDLGNIGVPLVADAEAAVTLFQRGAS